MAQDRHLAHERLVSTDWYTDELFALPSSEAIAVRFPVSRLVLDPERFEDDAAEPLARAGRGVIYTHMANGLRLRAPMTTADRDALIAHYYHAHHTLLSKAVAEAVRDHGMCLLIDCHSFPSTPLLCDLDQAPDRPDICLGTDLEQTPTRLIDAARTAFEAEGFTVAINRPYAGVLIPLEHTGPGKQVSALMIEINRRLYMDEATGARTRDFDRVRAMTGAVIRELVLVAGGKG